MAKRKILLALASPLYAPLYLAYTRKLTPEWNDVEFDYPKPPKKGGRTDKNPIHDPLLNQLLETHTERRKCVLAVADPMRIINFPQYAGQDEPYVVRTLIKTMCYWALDAHDVFGKDRPFIEDLRGLIVHPQGMTGYNVPLYDMVYNQKCSSTPDSADGFKDFLYDSTTPGEEKFYYHGLRIALKKRRSGHLGFVTMDPVDGNMARSDKTKTKLIKSFSEERSFQNVIMTGLITGKNLYDNPNERGFIDGLLLGVQNAIDMIGNDPVRSACDLEDYIDDPFINFRTDYNLRSLADSLISLVNGGAYDSQKTVDPVHLANSIAIVEKLRRFLPSFQRRIEDFSSLFNVAQPATP